MTNDQPILSHTEKLRLIKLGLLPKECVPKPKKAINKVSAKRQAENKAAKELGTDGSLDRWFEERRSECTGRCVLCGGKSQKSNDDNYRNSIHHLLDKRKSMFPSLALHPVNFLEVCFYGNSCHQNIHNGRISWELLYDSAEWKIIKPKLEILLPLCTADEKKNKLYSKLVAMVYLTPKH